MFLVKRIFGDRDKVMSLAQEHDQGHKDHLQKYTRTVVVCSLLNDDGEAVGNLSISDYDDEEDIKRYVYEDPFTKAGLYDSIEIQQVRMYKLDGSYECCPEWFYDEMKRRQGERAT